MAESPIERLKRLAREKKEAAASVTQSVVTPVANPATGEAGALAAVDAQLAKLVLDPEVFVENSEANLELRFKLAAEKLNVHEQPDVSSASSQTSAGEASSGTDVAIVQGTASSEVGKDTLAEDTPGDTSVLSTGPVGRSNHPLAMEFAEMEAALLSKDPNFKMILRQIHRHLATDPDLVTQMTEEETQAVVSGLVVIANAEVVEPAKAKTVKAAVAKAKKVTISVDDL